MSNDTSVYWNVTVPGITFSILTTSKKEQYEGWWNVNMKNLSIEHIHEICKYNQTNKQLKLAILKKDNKIHT